MVHLRVIGECAIEVGGVRVEPDSERLFAALLYLGLNRGRSVARTTMVQLLWPGAAEENGRHNFRQTIYKARRSGVTLACTPSHVVLDAASVDAGLLEVLDVAARGDGSAELPGGLGEFLPGYAPPFSEPFAEWVEEQRALVHAQLRRTLLAALALKRAAGRWADVEAVARDVLRLDPLNEEATLALAEATAMTGGKMAALSILDRYLHEMGVTVADVRLPATVLRRRIAERLPQPRYRSPSDAYFFGRAESLALLTTALQSARGGRGRGCLVWGAPGIGKTRLGAEFFKVAALQGARAHRAVCQPSDARRPLSVFVDTVPALLKLPGAVGCDPASLPYLRRLTDHDATTTSRSEETRDAELLYANVRRALFDLLDAIATECCLVLLIEDVHWLDAMSWELLRAMIAWAETRRILFVLTSREPHAEPVPGGPVRGLERHALPALDAGASTALLAALAGCAARAADPEFTEWAVRVADGNPLFLRELATAWADSGVLQLVPASLTTLIDDRLSRLSANATRLLQSCAVLGKLATVPRVERMLAGTHYQMAEGLDELEAHGMLAADAARVPAKHELLADRVLARLGDGTRAYLHRRAALALEEEIETAGSAALVWDGVAHWQAAGEPERGVRLVLLCAAHLVEVGLPSDAVEVYERGLGLCRNQHQYNEMFAGRLQALEAAGKWRTLYDVLTQFSAPPSLATRRTTSATDIELLRLEAAWRVGDEMEGLLYRAVTCVEDVVAHPDARLRAACWALIFADNLCNDGAATNVFGLLRAGILAEATDTAASARAILIYETTFGDLSTAVDSADRLLALEDSRGAKGTYVRALRYAAQTFRRAGLFVQAHRCIQHSLQLSEKLGLATGASAACALMGHLHLDQSQTMDAKQWHAKAQDWRKQLQESLNEGEIRYLGARVALLEGRYGDARALMRANRQDVLQDTLVRRRAAALGIYALTAVGLKEQTDAALLESLLSTHQHARRFGGQDFSTFALCTLLHYNGRGGEADSLCSDYLRRHRRERFTYPFT